MVLLCHAATAATRTTAFAGDEPLEPNGMRGASTLVGALPRVDRVLRAPSLRCRQTAEAVGLAERAEVDERLAGCDFGAWTGRTLHDVIATSPDAVTTWLTDPAANPHGGESITALLIRVGSWLDSLGGMTATEEPGARALLAVADPTVIRACVVHAMDARPRSIWRVDVPPLSQTVLAGGPGRWSLRALRPTDH